MKKTSFTKRIIASFLALVMVIGLIPNIAVPAKAAEQANLNAISKIADNDSFESWRDYYGNNSLLPDGSRGVSTWKAGGVWTDKSVYSDSTKFPSTVTMDNQANNFLIALSALASNKEIVGQSTNPTDSFLVLDVSGSMDSSDKAEGMVEAANRAIHSLMAQNRNNRVGVMLYSGTRNDNGATATTLLLPLDHYTTTSTVNAGSSYRPEMIPSYLTISDDNSSPEVSISSGVRNLNNVKPSSVKRNVVGATYIQRGLFDTWKEFEKVTDIKVPEGNVQAGLQRSPVIVLMSDGRPTLATDKYNNVSLRNSDYGNGTDDTTSWQTVFLTQLTAAWVKGAVGNHYGTDATLYTLGLGTSNDRYATGVLNPTDTNNNSILNWWNNFNNGTKRSDGTVRVQNGNFYQQSWDIPYDEDRFAVNGRNYTDGYWSASDISGMIKAFQEIIEEIGLQSAYSATLVEKGESDFDGYITVQDELGSMMQVKDIKGILLGNTLFSGEELAKSINEGDLGGAESPTAYGDEFIATVKERLGLVDKTGANNELITATAQAQQLIQAAYMDKQLSYNNATGAYSNYIGWYGDENNAYLGFWDKDTGFTATGAPDGTKYINQSYGYLGGASTDEHAADMMHIVVMVRTEISTGHQTVLFRIPASLIPMVEYKVEIEGDSLEAATDITLTVTENDPIRLVYEVGLPDDVNSVNIDQKVKQYLAQNGSNHIHKDANGNYVFYANGWDNNHDDVAPIISNLNDAEKLDLTKYVAESHFIPNTVNERFYVQENSVVHTKSGNTYTPVTSGIDTNTSYYFPRTIVTMVNGTARAVTQYELIQPATVANENNFQKNTTTGYWEIKAGTIRQHLSNVIIPKTAKNGVAANPTNTIANAYHMWVNVTSNNPSDYNIYSFLGNNGKLTIAPATAIKVTKVVDQVADGASANEKFAINVTIDEVVSNPLVTDVNGNLLENGVDYISATALGKTVVTLNLSDNESAVISGLSDGVTYTVTEAAHSKYTASYTNQNGTTQLATMVESTVTNSPIMPGSLSITKEVEHAHGGETFPTHREFEFEVTFKDALGNPIVDTFQLENNYDANLTELATNANGVMTGYLRHGETVLIKDIPAGTTVTVKEVNIPDNYSNPPAYRSRNQSGENADNDGVVTIASGKNATVVVTNTYSPKATDVKLDVTAHKTLISDAPAQSDVVLVFAIEKWNDTTQRWDNVKEVEKTWNKNDITQGTDTKDFDIGTVTLDEFTEVGTYTYRIVEKEPNIVIPGLAYDKTVYSIIVTVIDNNGQLVATVTDGNNPITDLNSDGALDFTANFTNRFDYAPVSIEIVKAVNNKSNTPQLSLAGFEFAAYEANSNWSLIDETADIIVTSDSNGSARLTATYDTQGIHYYVVKELDTPKPGWTDYSDAEYHVTVTVGKDNAGNLVSNMTIEAKSGSTINGESASYNGNSGTIIFKNTYNPQSAKVDLNITPAVRKDIEGRNLVAGEFTFAIFKNNEAQFDTDGKLLNIEDAVATGTNDADGDVIFTPAMLTLSTVGKHEFDIVEVKGDKGGVTYDATIYDMVVEVTDDASGSLKYEYYFEDAVSKQVTFNNTYTTNTTKVVIEGSKKIKVESGVKALTANMFTFGLYENNVKKAETKNLANGNFVFDAIEYDLDDVGNTFTYTVKEIAPNDSTDGSYSNEGMSYSGQSFVVTVRVIDNGDGTLSTAVVGNGADTIKFVNTYNSKLASVTLNGLKKLVGRNLQDGEYSFALHESNANFTEKNAVVLQNGQNYVTNDANGKFAINIKDLGMGYHYYILSEVIPDVRAKGISYDANAYHITVQVSDGGNGQMNAITTVYHSGQPNVSNPDIIFNNVYSPENDELPISGSKTYNGGKALENNVFSVGLYDSNDDLLKTAQIKSDGSFAFENLEYTAADVGNTYTYKIKEIIPDGATDNANGTFTFGNNIYDGSVYTLEVTITDDDKDGALNIATSLKKNGSAANGITFINTFVPDSVTYGIKAKKTYLKGLEGRDFEFNLVSADNKIDVNQTKFNAANGDIIFDDISFDAAGEYKFTVKEVNKLLGFISYSVAEYEVTITVVNENGILRVSNVNTVNTKNTAETNLEFINTYVLDGEDQVTLRGTKKLTGDRTQVIANEFEFGLYDAEDNLVEAVKNDADGKFEFTALKFDEKDVSVNGQKQVTYTVKEIKGSDTRVTYDETVYTVVVTVKDNDQGGVTATYTVNNIADGPIEFNNIYTSNSNDITVDFDIIKTVVNKGSEKIGPEGFEFMLKALADGVADTTVKTDESGKAKFTLTFTENDIGNTYTYKLTEVNGGKANVTYSTAEYTITVAISKNQNNELVATLTKNGENTTAVNAEFENVYDYTPAPEYPDTPQTGDNSSLYLWFALLFVSGGGIFGITLYNKKSRKEEAK